MDRKPSTPGSQQATISSNDVFEQFFLLCREYAQIARERRKQARQQTTPQASEAEPSAAAVCNLQVSTGERSS